MCVLNLNSFMWFANDFFWNSKKETPKSHHENKPLQTLKRNQNHVQIKLSSNHKLHETNVLSCTKYLTIGILILSWEIKSLKLVWDIRTNKIVQSLKRCKQVQTKLIHDYLMSHCSLPSNSSPIHYSPNMSSYLSFSVHT